MILELIERLTQEAGKRNMDFLLIGGQAISVLGHLRLTMDIDFLVLASNKTGWEELLGIYGYRSFSEGKGFAQFEGKPGWPRVDLMLVDDSTFAKLRADAIETKGKRTPSPKHMVALKLHAIRSGDRDPDKANQDWIDIRKLVELHGLDPNEGTFASLIRRYGGDEALERIRGMCQS
jgi:hypothetical protein